MLTILQGFILYNNRDFWKSYLLTTLDIVRVVDDLGKYFVQYSLWRIPLHGVHGSFLLIRGQVENEIGWDDSSIVEDYTFSMKASLRWSLAFANLLTLCPGVEGWLQMWLDKKCL